MLKESNIYEIMDKAGVGALIILNRYNRRYLTGYCGDTGVAYVSKSQKVILTDFRYIYQAEAEAKGFKVIDVTDTGYAKGIAELAKEDQIIAIGFEEDELNYSQYKSYVEKLEGISLVAMKDELSNLRMVKTKDELENIKMAEHIGDIAFSRILDEIKPGVTELEIAAKLEYIMKTNGAEGISFDPIVASGINSSMPHAVPSRKKIEYGDFLTLDFGCLYNGYCSDMTRTVVVGKANEKQLEIYNTVLKAQLAVLDQLKAGMTGKAIDKIARDIIYSAGYDGCFGHGLGHSVGLFIHESPRASMKAEELVLENMTLTVEPGIYVKDFGGVRIEDLVVVTKDGCENFTHSEKRLIEL